MSVIKPLSGHGNLVDCRCRSYLLGLGQWESKYHGNRCSKVTYINIAPDKDSCIHWDEQMDRDREIYGTNKQIGNNPVRTYNQYIFSPDPKDNISVDELDRAIKEWAERVFHNKFSIVIGYQNDNTNQIQHAHMYINNVNWDFDDTKHKRIGSYVTPQCWEFANQLWQYMCEERGWHSFLNKQIKDTEFQKYIDKGIYDAKLEYISEETKNLFEIDREYFKQYKYFSHDINYKRPFRKIKNIKDSYMTKTPFSSKDGKKYTRAAQELKARGEHLWTDDIRDLIEIAYYQSYNISEFLRYLTNYDIKVGITKDKDFKFTHPEKESWAVTGKKLGNDYRRDRLIAMFKRQGDIEYRPYKPNHSQNEALTKHVREIGYTISTQHIGYKDNKSQLTLDDIAKAIRICSKINCWSADDFTKIKKEDSSEDIIFAQAALAKLESLDNIREQYEKENPLEPRSAFDLERIPKEVLIKNRIKHREKLLREISRIKKQVTTNYDISDSRSSSSRQEPQHRVYSRER